jgi:hypothetical protein
VVVPVPVPAAEVSTVVVVADVSTVWIESTVAFADESAAFSVFVALSLHAAKAPIARTNKSFFIFELFEFVNNVCSYIPVVEKGNPAFKKISEKTFWVTIY